MESGGAYEDVDGVNLRLALSLPGEKILWAKRVPILATFRRGAGVFGLAIAAPIIFVVLCVCELIFVSVEGSQEWPQWVLMIWTLLCVIVLYVIFLWNKLLGVRIDVVTNLRVVNIVIRSTADSIEKSFLPLTSIDTIYAGYNQVTFNSKRPTFNPSTIDEEDKDSDQKPLVPGYKPSNKISLRGPHHSRLAIQFADVGDPDAIKALVEGEKSKLYRTIDASNPAYEVLQREWSHVEVDSIPEEYHDLALPYVADGEKIVKMFQPARFKRWIYGRRMPYVLGFSLWLLVFAFWIADVHSTDLPAGSGSGSASASNSVSSASIAFTVIVVIFVVIIALGLPPLWIVLDNAFDGVDCMLERSGILFLRKGARRDLKLFCGPNAVLASYDDILPITMDKDEMTDSGYVYLRGLDNNSEMVEVDNLNDFEFIVVQKIFKAHLRQYSNNNNSTDTIYTAGLTPEILSKYETAEPVYGDL